MAEGTNVFQTIAQGVANTNQNVVEVYKILQDIDVKISAVYSALFTQDNSNMVANEGGNQKEK